MKLLRIKDKFIRAKDFRRMILYTSQSGQVFVRVFDKEGNCYEDSYRTEQEARAAMMDIYKELRICE